MAVENVNPPIPPDEPDPILIADLREVPLEYLGQDADARHLVIKVMESVEGPSRVGVAMFSSGI
jgi:hypothetical protein